MAIILGNLFLWLALFFAILQFIATNKKNITSKFLLNKISTIALFICILLSFLILMVSYVVSDFSVENVFQNSHTTKPLLYKISAVWGNHEGSMILWLLVLVIFNYFIFRLVNKTNSIFIFKTLETQAFIIIGFLLFTLVTSNPFHRLVPTPINGLGFNPILQDPALAIHPPLLYIGYVGFSAAFSFSVAALSTSDYKIPWHHYMRPFVTIAWTFLTIGITFGSIWAYYELGWGGWWFWDPVENASFMPWLLGTALVHSLIAVEKKKILQNWVLLLAILSFLLSVTGTFLVRSGILTSVHTFALDPTRGIYILIFMGILGAYSLYVFAVKSKKFADKNYISFFSKEGALLINNILMLIVFASVFLGTIYPLVVETISNTKISVGEPYYNSTVIPIILPAILIMGIGPILTWTKINLIKTFKKIFPNILITVTITIIFLLIYKSYNLLGLLGVVLAFWIISNVVVSLIQELRVKNKISKFSTGMVLAHLGIGLLILGITGSSIWQKEKILRMKLNDRTIVNDYKIVLKEMNKIKISNYVALQGKFLVYDNKGEILYNLIPENRFYPITNNATSEPAIHTNLLRDLYIVLGEGDAIKGWTIRIYYNPLVAWIWVGAFMIFVGGLFSLKNNLKITRRFL